MWIEHAPTIRVREEEAGKQGRRRTGRQKKEKREPISVRAAGLRLSGIQSSHGCSLRTVPHAEQPMIVQKRVSLEKSSIGLWKRETGSTGALALATSTLKDPLPSVQCHSLLLANLGPPYQV